MYGLVSELRLRLGSLPLTTFAQNNGVDSNDWRGFASCGQIYCGDFGIVGLVPRHRPRVYHNSESGLGGAMVLMFGLIAIAGVRILVSHGIRRREAVIAATSVGLGFGRGI